MKKAAVDSGALGCGISGSGPSLFAFSVSEKIALNAGKEMQNILNAMKVRSEIYVSKINRKGATVMD